MFFVIPGLGEEMYLVGLIPVRRSLIQSGIHDLRATGTFAGICQLGIYMREWEPDSTKKESAARGLENHLLLPIKAHKSK